MTEPPALFDAEEILEAVRTRRHDTYPAYNPSGVEWLGDVPEHWDVKRLKQIARVQFSNVDKHTVEGEIPVRLCNYTDVYYNDTITADLQFMEATATKHEIARFKLEPGDVLVTKDSEDWSDIAVPALVKDEFTDVLCGYHLAQMRPFANCCFGSYLARAFASSGIADQFRVAASGVTRYGLPKGALQNALFPVPTLEEQQAIARFLDEETEKIDDLISAKRDLLTLLKEKRQAVITHAVARGLDPAAKLKPSGVEWLGDVPEHWDAKSLKHVAGVQFSNVDKHTVEGEIPVRLCNYTDVYYNDRITAGLPFMEATATKQEIAKFRLELGDVIVTKDSENWSDIAVPALEAVREGSNTGKSPQHQAAHHRMDHGLATLA